LDGHRTAEDLGGDVRIGGAPRVGQQAGVIGLRRSRAVDAEPIAEPHRDHRGVQPMLERKPHAEVRGQAQGRNQLRGADLFAVLRRLH
jgi:hypothetical protein